MRIELIVCLASCVPPAAGPHQDVRRVTITMHGALIGPSKADGSAWDGDERVSTTDVFGASGIAGLSVTAPEAVLAAMAANYVLEEASKPDSFGYADIFIGQRALRLTLPKHNDNFAPTWNRSMLHVPWTRSTRISVTLIDSDTFQDDPIGTVHITTSDLESALADGRVHNFRVGDQSQNQILFIAASVTPEGWVYQAEPLVPTVPTPSEPPATPTN